MPEDEAKALEEAKSQVDLDKLLSGKKLIAKIGVYIKPVIDEKTKKVVQQQVFFETQTIEGVDLAELGSAIENFGKSLKGQGHKPTQDSEAEA